MRVMFRSGAIAGALLILGGCATPSDRIANELVRYGLTPQQADCVGDRLEARLSLPELQQLGSAVKAYSSDDTNPGQLTLSDFARVSAQIKDPQVPIEVATAAASCGLLGSLLSR